MGVKRFGAGVLALLLLLVTGCTATRTETEKPAGKTEPTAQAQADAGSQKGGTLTIASSVDPPGFDPVTQTPIASWQAWQLVYETLINRDDKGNLVPALAERWEASDDGLTHTFSLRKGVKFHNGEELTAEDVKYSFDRLWKVGIPYMQTKFKMVQSVDVVDAHTVRFTLKEKNATFYSYLSDDFATAAAIVSRKAGAELNDDFNKTMVGTGPLRFVEYVPKDHITYERWDSYWGEKVQYEKLVVRLVPDASSQLAALRSGQVDLIFPKAETAPLVEKDKSLVLRRFVSDWHDGLHLNAMRKPFDNVKVRQAIMLGIDRGPIIQASVLGEGVPTGPLTPSHPWHVPTEQLPNYKRDVAKAKQLLAEAGYPNGFTTTILASTSYPFNVRQAEMIQQQLAEIGVTLEIEKAEWAVVNKRTNEGDYDAAVYAFLSYPDVEFYLLPRETRVGPPPAEMKALFEKGATTMDLEARRKIYEELQHMTAEMGYPVVWLVAQNGFVAHKPYVKGYEPDFTLSWRPLLKISLEK